MSKWGVHNCTRGVSCNETNSNWIDQLWCESTSNFYQVSKKLYLLLHKRIAKATWPSKAALVYVKEIGRVQDVTLVFPKLTNTTTNCETLNKWDWLLFSGFLPTQGTCMAHEEHLLLPISCYLFQSVGSNWTSILVRHSTMTRLLCIESISYRRCVLILWNTLVLQPNWMQLKVSLKCNLCNA